MVKFKLKYKFLLGVSPFVVLLDQLTKSWIVGHFQLSESYTVIPDFFNIIYAQNRGAAFGILSQADEAIRVPFFFAVPLIALGTVFYIFRKMPEKNRLLEIALSLVIGGAVGNIIDRSIVGYVIDFLDFHWKSIYHFPAFNVADSAITVGVGLILIELFFFAEPPAGRKNLRS